MLPSFPANSSQLLFHLHRIRRFFCVFLFSFSRSPLFVLFSLYALRATYVLHVWMASPGWRCLYVHLGVRGGRNSDRQLAHVFLLSKGFWSARRGLLLLLLQTFGSHKNSQSTLSSIHGRVLGTLLASALALQEEGNQTENEDEEDREEDKEENEPSLNRPRRISREEEQSWGCGLICIDVRTDVSTDGCTDVCIDVHMDL